MQDALARVLSQPVPYLVTAGSHVAIEAAEQWDLPDGDRAALREWGLPRLPLFTPRPQVGTVPALPPNRAGRAPGHA